MFVCGGCNVQLCCALILEDVWDQFNLEGGRVRHSFLVVVIVDFFVCLFFLLWKLSVVLLKYYKLVPFNVYIRVEKEAEGLSCWPKVLQETCGRAGNKIHTAWLFGLSHGSPMSFVCLAAGDDLELLMSVMGMCTWCTFPCYGSLVAEAEKTPT